MFTTNLSIKNVAAINNCSEIVPTTPHLPLLSYPQEIRYIRRIQRMMKLIAIKQVLTSQIQRKPSEVEWASAANISLEELRYALRCGYRAKRRMIEAHMHLVEEIAKCYSNNQLELAELICAGKRGLERGLVKFNPAASGSHFIVYVRWLIERQIGLVMLTKFVQKHQELVT